MNNRMKHILIAILLAVLVLPVFSAGTKEVVEDTHISILVYITGVTDGSPPYEEMVAGAEEFAAAHDEVTVKVYEAGFNQAQWEEQLTSLVATGEYDIVLGTNPSFPEICERVGNKFPEQKFIITDAYWEGNDQIRTYLFNQYEQSLFLGYLAGLVTTSDMTYANKALKIGFITAQEFPLLNKHMVPGFLAGAQMVNPDITLDYRVIGNWYDANKTAELAQSMIDNGVDVFAAIAGGAAQGLFKVAQDEGAYIVFHNTNEYATVPSYIVGCGSMEQKKVTLEALQDALDGTVEYGKASVVGLKEGYVKFFDDDPLYEAALPESVRTQFAQFMKGLEDGSITYTIPEL